MKLTFKKYALLGLLAVIITYIIDYILDNTASAVGVIGGADGPTAIFVASKANESILDSFIDPGMYKYIVVFLFLLLLYKPISKMIKKS